MPKSASYFFLDVVVVVPEDFVVGDKGEDTPFVC
jgi:hypothetical protein